VLGRFSSGTGTDVLTIKRGNSLYEIFSQEDLGTMVNCWKQNPDGLFVFDRSIEINQNELRTQKREFSG
jgi:hypothetical protein